MSRYGTNGSNTGLLAASCTSGVLLGVTVGYAS